MTSFWQIFSLEWKSLVRSKAILLLTLASVGWLWVFPYVVTGDGTDEGFRELYLHFALGGVFALLVVSLVSSATGTLARERAERRLQLTLVRPVRPTCVALAKIAALSSVGAAILALSCVLLPFAWRGAIPLARPCAHVVRPLLPSPKEEAREAYAAYMADPHTPAAVKKARRDVVLRLLENRAVDRYETISTNGVARWTFPGFLAAAGAKPRVRFRFSTAFNTREDVAGVFSANGWRGAVSNVTQAVLTTPLSRAADEIGHAADELVFHNRGAGSLMLRPRRDVELLLPADAFGWNLLRAYLELVALLTLVIAFGTFLGAGLGRPVALFVAIVTLILGEVSPSVVEQYPDALETKLGDRIGLFFTRFAAEVTRPVAALDPLASLSRDECVEPREVMRVWLTDAVLATLLLALLAGFALPRKMEEGT